MRKIINVVLLLLFSQSANSACNEYAIANTEDYRFSIGDAYCAKDDTYLFVTKTDGSFYEEYLFKNQCNFNENRSGFSCREDGDSILSGTQYEKIKNISYECDLGGTEGKYTKEVERLGCKKGCDKPNVPKIFILSFDCA